MDSNLRSYNFIVRLFAAGPLLLLLVSSQFDGLMGVTHGRPAKRLIVSSLTELPEPFSNQKLPGSPQTTDTCFEFIGCLELLPTHESPQDPLSMKTVFGIFSRSLKTMVAFESVTNCLPNSSDHPQCAIYPFDLNRLLGSGFNPNLRTIIITGGFWSSAHEVWQQTLKDKWLELENVNVIVVAWTGGDWGLYPVAAANTRVVARQITVLLYYLAKLSDYDLIDEGFTDKVYLIGHSLGAHISGFVGKDLAGKVGRITGLDPAGPSFNGLVRKFRLDRSDAQLVDVIHTDGGDADSFSEMRPYFGIKSLVGHVDYFANNGKHQPNCHAVDVLGCSHKIAPDFYISSLDHELYLRQLPNHWRRQHRLLAHPSSSYEDFYNGSSIMDLCPISTNVNDNNNNDATRRNADTTMKDLDKCVVPIDFVAWFDDFRKELEEIYKIDFDPKVESTGRYFFFTEKDAPYLNSHNFIKIRVGKNEIETEEKKPEDREDLTPVCDIVLGIQMANGLKTKHELNGYKLRDQGDHYLVVVPYAAIDTNAKSELALLDSRGFFLNNTDRDELRTKLNSILPSSIQITGLLVSSSASVTNKLALALEDDFFALVNSPNTGQWHNNHCKSLPVESVSVQPLMKLSRSLTATYSIEAETKDKPELVVKDSPPGGSLSQPNHAGADDIHHDGSPSLGKTSSEVFIDTIFIGPFDDSDTPNQLVDFSDDEVTYVGKQTTSNNQKRSPLIVVQTNFWLALTISTFILTSVVAVYVSFRIIKVQAGVRLDRHRLVNDVVGYTS